MNLQTVTYSPCTFLPSGILIVEPHEGLLAARTMLLAAADYYVGVSGSETSAVPKGRTDADEVVVAILSESLGHALLSATAQAIRVHWPRARILILGQTSTAIEDGLFDARIDHKCRPEELLAALMLRPEDPWNQRARPARVLTSGRALLPISSLYSLAESDPTKRYTHATSTISPRDIPTSDRQFKRFS